MDTIKDYYNNKKYRLGNARKTKILTFLKEERNKKILDVGCSSGFLGEILKKQDNEVIGIDISSQAIEQSKKVLDNAYLLNIEEEELPFPFFCFDIIILAEILEHLFDQKTVLLKLKPFLKEKGYLIITTPNFLFWKNRLKILMGKFEYQNDGLLDEAHIHFFTYHTLFKILKDTGFRVISENHTILFTRYKILQKFATHFPSLFAFQFIIKAQLAR